MELILVRYGEIGLKGANRSQFLKRLRSNLRACLKAEGIAGSVEQVGTRIYVRAQEVEEALAALERVFGVVSLSPASRVGADLEEMKAEALRVSQEEGLAPGKTFRVRSRRADKSFPLTSLQIDASVGGFIKERTGGKVDLSERADLIVEIEVLEGGALVYCRRVAGFGGLPLGTQGRAVALLSGGIDSPVAAWMMMRRGCAVIPVHFSQSQEERAKMLDNCAVLSRYSYGWDLKPVLESHQELFGETCRRLADLGAERWTCIFCKRALLRRGEEIAKERGAHAIIIGDSLGQVASQTLENLRAISYGVSLPILRPLIGMDKTQIVELARKIGTFEVSTRETKPCPYLPRHPVTRADWEKFLKVLERLG